jgi:nucleotide-binding universal stress UspA family protein
MRRFKNILVAVDGFEPSFHALEESIRLAQWGKGGVTVIHVAPSYEGDLSLVGVKNIKATVSGSGREVLDEAISLGDIHNLPIKPIYEEGEVPESIARLAAKEDVDLIVLGASKTSLIAGFFSGNVLTKMIRNCSREILVIPNQAVIGWDRILFAADRAQWSEDTVARAIELAVSYGSELQALAVTNGCFSVREKLLGRKEYPSRKSTLQSLENAQIQAERAGVRIKNLFLSGRFHTMVNEIARE